MENVEKLKQLIPGIKTRHLKDTKCGVISGVQYKGNTLASSMGTCGIYYDVGSALEKLPAELTLKNRVWVDIGCGDSGWRMAIAGAEDARAYIGVDPYNAYSLASAMKSGELTQFLEGADKENTIKGMDKIPNWIISEGIEDFMKRLPNRSVNYMMSSVDSLVLGDKFPYEKFLEELARTTEENGVFISYMSHFWSLPEREGSVTKSVDSAPNDRASPTTISWYEPV